MKASMECKQHGYQRGMRCGRVVGGGGGRVGGRLFGGGESEWGVTSDEKESLV